MKWICLFVLLTTCTGSWSKEGTTENDNDITTIPSVRIDKNLRRALLKALEQLEKEDDDSDVKIKFSMPEKVEYDEEDKDQIHFIVKSKQNQATDKSKETVFLHTYTADSSKNENKYKADKSSDNSAVDITASPSQNVKNSFINAKKESSTARATVNSIATVTPKTTLSSPSPTASTQVTDEDEEEDISKVKVEDVQFINAPLVAAFTVQQDERGLPQKVIPIFGSKTTTTTKKPPVANAFIDPFRLTLENKQQNLELQIQLLQQQQRQQELLRQQQELQIRTLQEQRKQQLQEQERRKQLEEQQRLQSQFKTIQNDFSFAPSKAVKPTQGTFVSLTPSISFQPNTFNNPSSLQSLKFNQRFTGQLPPIKEAVNFDQIPLLTPFIPLVQQVPHKTRDVTFSNSLSKTLLPPHQSNRVFRHETNVGNFGLNDVQHNRFNSFQSSFNPTVLRSQAPPQIFNGFHGFNHHQSASPNVDARIKNLIYQSGFGDSRANEDINIISEVLALNHNPYSNIALKDTNRTPIFNAQTNFAPFKF